MQPTALPERIASKISTDAESGCWVWGGALDANGYGQLHWNGSTRGAHRIVYFLLVEELPRSKQLDHRCFNHACVNPEHLRPVTNKQNGEHREGVSKRSKSGVRGVTWHPASGLWFVRVKHNYVDHYGGYFRTVEEAEPVAKALRAKLFTHEN